MTRKIIKPLIIASAVGMICQNLMAATVSDSPFASKPLDLSGGNTINEATGTKPNIVFFVDDSGSMIADDSPYRIANKLKFWGREYRYEDFNEIYNPAKDIIRTDANIGKAIELYYSFTNYYPGRGYLPRSGYFKAPVRLTIVKDAMNALVVKYKDKVNWGITSLWGTFERNSGQNGRYYHETKGYNSAEAGPSIVFPPQWDGMHRYINALNPAGTTPTTTRYIYVANELAKQIKYRCQKNYIVILSDGDSNGNSLNETAKMGSQSYTHPVFGTFTHPGKVKFGNALDTGTYGETINYTPPPGKASRYPYKVPTRGYKTNATESIQFGDGISLLSHILYHTDLKTGGVDAEGGSWDEPASKQWLLNEATGKTEEQKDKPSKQNIETFSVGFVRGLSPEGKTYLQDAATGGDCHGNNLARNAKLGKCYFEATDANSLAKAFESILQQATKREISRDDRQIYNPSTPTTVGAKSADKATSIRLDQNIWGSFLQFSELDTNKTDANGKENENYGTILSGQQVKYADYSGTRKIIVNSGRTNNPAKDVYEFSPNITGTKLEDFGFEATQRQEFQLAFAPWYMRSTPTDTQLEAAVSGLSNRAVDKYRDRLSHIPRGREAERQLFRMMGDVIKSPMVSLDNTTNPSPNALQEYIITAANDGMTYIFKATGNNNSPYRLALNYLPAGMQRESAKDPNDQNALTVGRAIKKIAEEGYGLTTTQNHLYLNDGGLAWVKTPQTGGLKQQYALVGTMGRGGRGAYALNISGENRATGSGFVGMSTPPNNWVNNVPLWETEKSTSNSLGYTVSTPAIGQVATEFDGDTPKKDLTIHAYTFIANGYKGGDPNTANPSYTTDAPYDATATLYVYDLLGQNFGAGVTTANVRNGNQPGKLIARMPVGPEGAGAGLSTPVLYDADMDGLYDFAFAGDTKGNMWRFDLRTNPGNWNSSRVRLVYRGLPTQPITAAPSIYKVDKDQVVVIFGTGSDLYEADKSRQDRQALLGIYNKVTDPNAAPVDASSPAILDQSVVSDSPDPLNPATYGQTGGVRTITNKAFDKNTHQGWRLTLREGNPDKSQLRSAEMITDKADVFINTVYVTSRMYGYKSTTTGVAGVCSSSTTTTDASGFSWVMSIDAQTGGVPRTNGKDSSFASLLASDKATDKKASSAQNQENGAVGKSFSLASGAKIAQISNGKGDVLNTNAQGESLEGGLLASFKKNKDGTISNDSQLAKIAKGRKCLPRGQDVVLTFGTRNEGAQVAAIQANRCGADVFIRVNWREVPL